jgi:hypothetical protein
MATTKRAQADWQISRGFVGPLGHVFFRRIFTVKARNQDQAIERAAHKVKGIAMLKARRLQPPRRSFFLCLKLVKK